MTELVLRNGQRTRAVNAPLLRRVASVLLTDLLSLDRCELAIHLVAAPEMARVNQQFLDHAGSTDVITFDYRGKPSSTSSPWFNAPAIDLLSSGGDGASAAQPSSAAARHRPSPSLREARTGRRVPKLGQPASSSRSRVGGEGVGSSRHRAQSMRKGTGRGAARVPGQLHGEILICIDAAVKQARQFRTTWQSELIRYLIHGVLHLVGYDDLSTAARRVMKREENRLLRTLSRQFSLKHLASATAQIANRKS